MTVAMCIVVFNLVGCKENKSDLLEHLPEYATENDIQNYEWYKEERIKIQDYSGDAMEIGISPDGEYLLFNDNKKRNKDMHWSTRIDARTYQYKGKVKSYYQIWCFGC